MTAIDFGAVNWLAVVVAALAYFAIGSIWYIPATPMGQAWARAIGFVSHPGEQGQANPSIYALPMLGHVVTAAITAALAAALNVQTVTDGMLLAVVVWIGFHVPNWILASVFNPHAKKPMQLIGLYSSHHLVGMLAMGAILGAWR
jgi:hypothetical protein